MDLLSILGLVIGFGMILMGQYLEGGHLATLMNGPALMIVLGGSIGAILLQSPMATFQRAIKLSHWIFQPPAYEVTDSIKRPYALEQRGA